MMQMTMPKRTHAKSITLTDKLIAWRQRVARLLKVETIYQKHAAELLGIPLKTYKNYEPTLRRQPGALAIAELERRMERVESYLSVEANLKGYGSHPDEAIDRVVQGILDESVVVV